MSTSGVGSAKMVERFLWHIVGPSILSVMHPTIPLPPKKRMSTQILYSYIHVPYICTTTALRVPSMQAAKNGQTRPNWFASPSSSPLERASAHICTQGGGTMNSLLLTCGLLLVYHTIFLPSYLISGWFLPSVNERKKAESEYCK